MSKIYSENLCVRDFYCDRSGKLSLPMIAELAISASIQQTSELGIGMEELQAAGRGWVLLQYDIKIDRRPAVGEQIQVTTEPIRSNQFFALRNFDFYDLSGKCLIHIASLWAMIDLKRRRLVSLDQRFIKPLNTTSVERLEKLTSPTILDRSAQGNSIADEELKPTYFDIDTNQHVNNSNYLRYFLIPVAADFMFSHEPKRIIIKYNKEIRLDQIVVSKVQFTGPLHSVHEIASNALVNATAEIEWAEAQ
ncbi:hypothetical protein OAL24_00113 [Oenococcus sicerae]|nr:hypothetical protein OAL24_00113 [Oenococcus sicerae]